MYVCMYMYTGRSKGSDCKVVLIFRLIILVYRSTFSIFPILFSFRLPECNARLHLIRAPTRNRNNEFIVYIVQKRWPIWNAENEKLGWNSCVEAY